MHRSLIKSLFVAAGLAVVLSSCSGSSPASEAAAGRTPARADAEVSRPLDIPEPIAVPADASSPYILQAGPDDKAPVLGEQVDGRRHRASPDTPLAFERPADGARSAAGAAALIPAPAADPRDPAVVARRIGGGGRGSASDATSQIVGGIAAGLQPLPGSEAPPAQGGFDVQGPTVVPGSGGPVQPQSGGATPAQ